MNSHHSLDDIPSDVRTLIHGLAPDARGAAEVLYREHAINTRTVAELATLLSNARFVIRWLPWATGALVAVITTSFEVVRFVLDHWRP